MKELSHKHNKLANSWRTVLFAKLIVTHLFKKFRALYGTQSSLPCSQEPATDPYPESDIFHSNIILPSTHRFSDPTKILCISHLSHACYINHPSYSTWFEHPITISWSENVMKLIVQSSTVSHNSSLWGPGIILLRRPSPPSATRGRAMPWW